MPRKASPAFDYVIEDRGYATPCHIWQRGMHYKGYGLGHVRTSDNPNQWTTKLAHVIYWEREHGPVPPGLELDHLCSQRPCCREDHLEAVTHAENCRRGVGRRGGRNLFALKSECKYGHPFIGENIIPLKSGGRICRECNKRRCREAALARKVRSA